MSQPPSWAAPAGGRIGPARWAVTDRRGGGSTAPWASLNLADHVGDDPAAVAANRDVVARRLGFRGRDVAVIAAAHGSRVAVVDRPGRYADVDALVTAAPGLVLMALAADCVPATVIDPVAGVAAVVHSGWRGVLDVASAAVRAMTHLGARADRCTAILGPAICPSCYEVSAQVRDLVAAAAPGSGAVTARGTPAVDIAGGVAHQLRAIGVSRIVRDRRCTFEDENLFSHRRDAVTGRHGIVVVLDGGTREGGTHVAGAPMGGE